MMPVINAHTHLIEIEKALSSGSPDLMQSLAAIPTFSNVEAVKEMVSLETLLAQMKRANVDKSVLYGMYAPILYSSNEYIAGICKQYPDHFIGFASVDLNSDNPAKMLEKAVIDLGLKGLKLHPPLQDFHPLEDKMWPVYEKAAALGIPVVFHVGSTPFGHLLKLANANPLVIDDIANRLPHLKIMLTHLGTLWHNEAFMVVEKHPNLYIDTAAYPYEIIEIMSENHIRRIGEDKFIFGTDYPMPYEGKLHELKDFVDTIQMLAISDELKEKIFYRNFEKMMAPGI